MGSVADRLLDAGHSLPGIPGSLGDYVPATRSGKLIFTSGQLPIKDGSLMATGLVGHDLAAERAQECAVQCALNALAAAATLCDLDDVEAVVKLIGYVASADSFTDQPLVINGASSICKVAFGESGEHAREAVGVARLPMDSPVEVSFIRSIRD